MPGAIPDLYKLIIEYKIRLVSRALNAHYEDNNVAAEQSKLST